MSEIEKMYRNSGIKKNELDYSDNFEPFYPEFTAEKQIELIKWLVHNTKQILITEVTNANSKEFLFGAYKYESYMKVGFDEALASFINNLWQDLTEEEKQQVKGILEQ